MLLLLARVALLPAPAQQPGRRAGPRRSTACWPSSTSSTSPSTPSITLATIAHSFFRHPSFLVRKQLKWIVTGLGFGVLPFTVLYIIPFLAGQAPSQVAELTILLQTLIPLSFAYSISRYKLMDLEVILKKAATLVFSYFVLALVYLVRQLPDPDLLREPGQRPGPRASWPSSWARRSSRPLKKLFQSLFDRVFYKRSYEYRKTLLSISRELSRERNLETPGPVAPRAHRQRPVPADRSPCSCRSSATRRTFAVLAAPRRRRPPCRPG